MARLSTEETASRLGVKRETVYAYVSRGILSRQKAVDGRASTFDENEVDRLRRARNSGHPGRLEAPVTTAVAEVRDGHVAYRGVPLSDLAGEGMTYEHVAAMLWDVPDASPWTADHLLVKAVARAMNQLPAEATLIDQLMAGIVIAAAHDPFRDDRSRETAAQSMRTTVAAVTEALPLVRAGASGDHGSIADRLWPRLTSAARKNATVLDQALLLLADHGMASSTIAARLAASTRAGPHAAVIAGLGALTGPLHGAASRTVHLMLLDAEVNGTEAAIANVLRTNGRVPGIGHFVHRTFDPRFEIMMQAIDQSSLDHTRRAVVEDLIDRTADRISAPHNIDFALGALTFAAGMQPDAGELVFAIARIAGWVAHTLEEYEEAPLRFRPVGRYDSSRPRPAPVA